MEDKFLILTLVIASLGFILWFTFSSSLLLPVRFQVLYDANPPYVNRIFRRRVVGALIYGVIPLFIIKCTKLLDRPLLGDLGISFQWNHKVGMWLLFLIPLVILTSLLTTNKTSNLEQFPEVRVRFWRPQIFIWSTIWWILYLTAYEFFYRGLLFQSLRFQSSDEVAVVACTAIYSLAHYFKRNRVSFFAILYGALSCYMVIDTGSILPGLILHIVNALSVEYLSLKHHPEMYLIKT
jgi:membrane protease YdiL (CAAX protease family)